MPKFRGRLILSRPQLPWLKVLELVCYRPFFKELTLTTMEFTQKVFTVWRNRRRYIVSPRTLYKQFLLAFKVQAILKPFIRIISNLGFLYFYICFQETYPKGWWLANSYNSHFSDNSYGPGTPLFILGSGNLPLIVNGFGTNVVKGPK